MPKVRTDRYEDENLEDEAHIVPKNVLVGRGINVGIRKKG
jgi:hypothetical protein